jgi:hypothetical protein
MYNAIPKLVFQEESPAALQGLKPAHRELFEVMRHLPD